MAAEVTILEKVERPAFSASLRNDGIVHFTMEEIEDYSLEIVKDQNQVLQKLGNGKKMPVMVSFKSFNTPNDESMKYSVTEEGTRYTKANAIVVESLALRIGANFYLNFFRPKVITRVFNSEKDAAKWLSKFVV